MDVATRTVLAIVVSFDPPSANTVALCLTRICSPKTDWLRSLNLDFAWPMVGIACSLHLDNGPEFPGRSFQRGCAEFGIDLIYRPPGRPHFGGHIERLIGTLMDGLKRLPGATGSSVKERRHRKPEKTAQLALAELERWLAIEVDERHHHSEHRGLGIATPFGAWVLRPPVAVSPERLGALPFAFLPAIDRKVRREGLFFNLIRYWHPLFAQWAPLHKRIVVHYDVRDSVHALCAWQERRNP
jgi:putative transposase